MKAAPRRARRVDANQARIIDALRKAGAWVHEIGDPFDLLCRFRRQWFVIEIKHEYGPRGGQGGTLTPAQVELLEDLIAQDGQAGAVSIVRTAEDALLAIGAV